MNHKKMTAIGLLSILLLTVILAAIHLSSRTDIPMGSLQIEQGGTTLLIDLSTLEPGEVRGSIRNGKGEEIGIDGLGIPLSQLLEGAGCSVSDTVSVIADDAYSAAVTRDELMESNRVFLLFSANERPRLIVFGDSDSKRNVSGVIRLVVS